MQRQFNAVSVSEESITPTPGMVETTGKYFWGVPLQKKQVHDVTLWTDASSQGWRAHMNDHQALGPFNLDDLYFDLSLPFALFIPFVDVRFGIKC